jgi:PAS domain S-box-containing protein
MSQPSRRPLVLVVEDNPITLKMLAHTLQAEGFEVLAAGTGQAAVEAARQRLPDLVLVDIVLPDFGGVELAGRLRRLPGGAEVPILALSAFLGHREEERNGSAVFTTVLVKPIAPSRLVDVVRGYLPRWQPAEPSASPATEVILVDDDAVQLKLAGLYFSQGGFLVRAARSAADCLRLARERPPDVIVSDVLMPEMDGFELCLELRNDPMVSQIPVVLVSSWYENELDRDVAHRVGANALVTRTPGFENVLAAAREATRGAVPVVTEAAAEPVRLAHARAVIQQLEGRLAGIEDLERRCVVQAAQIAVLSGIADALAERSDVDAATRDVLAATLDAAGISKGAIFLRDPGEPMRLRHAVGFSRDEQEELSTFFGQRALFERAIASGSSVTLASDAPDEASRALLAGAGAASAQLVPLGAEGRRVGVILLAAMGTDVGGSDAGAFARAMGNQLVQSMALADSFARIAASEHRYRALMEQAHETISVLTPEGVIREVNRSWEDTFGISRDVAVGLPIGALSMSARDSGDGLRKPLAETGRSGRQALRRADGTEVLMEFSATTIEVSGERLVLSIGRDISDQVRSQAQLMVADRMVSIGMLAAGVAHEINNPLVAVSGNLELAARELERLAKGGTEAAAAAEMLAAEIGDAREAADRVRDIVRDLRIFSRSEDEHSVPVDLHRVLESSLRLARNEIRHRAQVVKDFGAVPAVLANESRLGQVFLNLLVNAAQALPAGRADTHEIRLRTHTVDGWAVVEVTDSGPGMSAEVLQRLFTPFFTTKPVGVGTGLGLAICHRIVTGLHGDIAVVSEVGRGTTFRVSLPPAVHAAQPQPPPPPTPEARRRGRVLVVDDERMVAELVQRVLAGDHHVEVSTSAQQALARIAGGERFDLILCDLMMPVMTGMELYAELARTHPADAERIIFLTGGAFTPQARAFLDEVPNMRLEKPFDVPTLRRVVNERL